MSIQDEKQIRELLAAREAAMSARNAEALEADVAADVVAFTLAPPLVQQPADFTGVEQRRAWFAGFDGPIEYEIRDLEITVGGDVAYTHSLNRLSTTPKGMPAKFDLWFRSTVCLRRADGRWQITHVHESTPFYMDGTMRAALDLTP
ncbi:YybH family protein [Amycolatopsis sp. NPDC059021]|uniref:YybH family protein n=1 Tax=Amycolatopsis sp. NPDC059021 TaxID=3346704 RepID=UPI00366E9F99